MTALSFIFLQSGRPIQYYVFDICLLQPFFCSETMDEHVLTVMVKDQGTPSKRNYARVLVVVHDFNDHAPEFSSQIIQGRVYESAAPGSAVMQVLATDQDRGKNAEITYSIASGTLKECHASLECEKVEHRLLTCM